MTAATSNPRPETRNPRPSLEQLGPKAVAIVSGWVRAALVQLSMPEFTVESALESIRIHTPARQRVAMRRTTVTRKDTGQSVSRLAPIGTPRSLIELGVEEMKEELR